MCVHVCKDLVNMTYSYDIYTYVNLYGFRSFLKIFGSGGVYGPKLSYWLIGVTVPVQTPQELACLPGSLSVGLSSQALRNPKRHRHPHLHSLRSFQAIMVLPPRQPGEMGWKGTLGRPLKARGCGRHPPTPIP